MGDINISEVINALKIIREICKATSTCEDCPFMKRGSCYIKHVDPENWELNSTYIWRAFK